MLEVLSRENKGALDLPEFGEIASFIGSMVQRVKKGKPLACPKAKAPPIPDEIREQVQVLDQLWHATNHQLQRGDKLRNFQKLDIYEAIKGIHAAAAGGAESLPLSFPSQDRVFALVTAQRKVWKGQNQSQNPVLR
jgi:hypothetical protein